MKSCDSQKCWVGFTWFTLRRPYLKNLENALWLTKKQDR
jgi:hypothetical protein